MEPTPWDPEGVEVALDPDGQLVADAAVDGDELRSLYEALVAARSLDVRLARVGLPGWASAAGEEAPIVLAGRLARADDWIYPGLRDVSVALARGMSYDEVARQLRLRAAYPGNRGKTCRDRATFQRR